MPRLLSRFAPRLALLLLLTVAVGCFLFLFELFLNLTSSGGADLLAQNDALGPTVEISNGANLITMLAAAMCIALGAAASLLSWQKMRSRGVRRRWAISVAALPVAALSGLGIFLIAQGALGRSIPLEEVPYSSHAVDTTAIEPLGLIVLAAFFLSVAVIAITRPRLLPLPLGLWLVASLAFGLTESGAIQGLNLF